MKHIIKKSIWLVPRQLQREEKYEYPRDAIREAIVNAVVHRDYESPSKVQVRVFQNINNTTGYTATRDLGGIVKEGIFDKIGKGKMNLRYVLIQNAAKMRQKITQKGDAHF